MKTWILFIVTLVSACSLSSGNAGTSIVGKWQVVERYDDGKWAVPDTENYIEFTDSGDFNVIVRSETLRNKSYYTHMPNEVPPRIYIANKNIKEEFNNCIYQINGNKMTMVNYYDNKAGFPGKVDFDSPGKAYAAVRLTRVSK